MKNIFYTTLVFISLLVRADNSLKFSLDFISAMKERAKALNHHPVIVKKILDKKNLLLPYISSLNGSAHCSMKVKGKLKLTGKLVDVFSMWNRLLEDGRGLNDRFYADIVRDFSLRSQKLTLTKHMLVNIDEDFSIYFHQGKMIFSEEIINTYGDFGIKQSLSHFQTKYTKKWIKNWFEEKTIQNNCEVNLVAKEYQARFNQLVKIINPELKASFEITDKEPLSEVDYFWIKFRPEFHHLMKSKLDFFINN